MPDVLAGGRGSFYSALDSWPVPMSEPTFSDGVAMRLALASRDKHGVGLNGFCMFCRPETVWPCDWFLRAHAVIVRLGPRVQNVPSEPDAGGQHTQFPNGIPAGEDG